MKKVFDIDEKTRGFYEPGVRMEEGGICFTAAVPAGEAASLCLYEKESGELAAEIPFLEKNAQGSLRTIKVRDLEEDAYRYQYKIQGKTVTDPHARGIWRSEDGKVTMGELMPETFDWGKSRKPQIPYEEGIMYHLHVRNYTMHEKSGVAHRGTFLGLQEKIPYLKKLGVNQIILMPVCEFEEQETKTEKPEKKGAPLKKVPLQKNYWGYKTGFYYAPKKAIRPQRIRCWNARIW